ncbi:hypothetical protein B0T17DRAFT_469675, partial [Bombardia bombarda]
KEKGKQRASDQEVAFTSGTSTDGQGGEMQESNGLLSRIARSATSLPSALLSAPPTAEGLSQLGGSQKGDTSRTGELSSRPGESSLQARPSLSAGEALRPNQTREHIASQEADFAAFLDDTSPYQPTLGAVDHDEAWQRPLAGGGVEPSTMMRETGRTSPSVAEQEAHDGDGVVALLCGNSHGDVEQDYVEDETISAGDMLSLRRALFGEGSGSGSDLGHSISPMAWDNALNFIPEFLRQPMSGAAISEASLHLGAVDTDEGWQTWIGQWSRVLTEYHDEVWGDLGALVEQARVEVKRLEESETGAAGDAKPPVPTALLRLRAILGHLR